MEFLQLLGQLEFITRLAKPATFVQKPSVSRVPTCLAQAAPELSANVAYVTAKNYSCPGSIVMLVRKSLESLTIHPIRHVDELSLLSHLGSAMDRTAQVMSVNLVLET